MAIIDEQNIFGGAKLDGAKLTAFESAFPTQKDRPTPGSFINEFSDGAKYSLTDEEAAYAKTVSAIGNRNNATLKPLELGKRTELITLFNSIPEGTSPQNLRKVEPDTFRAKTEKAKVEFKDL